jgi:hypothetical protein
MGALDSNGIWQYDETDVESTASELLNKLAESTSDEIGDDRVRLTALEAVQRGKVNTTGAAGGSSPPVFWGGTETITFPTPFSVAPTWVGLTLGPTATLVYIGVNIIAVTATQITFRVLRIGSAPAAGIPVYWEARP